VEAQYFGGDDEPAEYSNVYTTVTETFELVVSDGINLFTTTVTFDANGSATSATPGAAPTAASCVTGELNGNTGTFTPPETTYGPPNPADIELPISHHFVNLCDTYAFSPGDCTANAYCPQIPQNPVANVEAEPIAEETAQASAIAYIGTPD
jgi:hypothetical protein